MSLNTFKRSKYSGMTNDAAHRQQLKDAAARLTDNPAKQDILYAIGLAQFDYVAQQITSGHYNNVRIIKFGNFAFNYGRMKKKMNFGYYITRRKLRITYNRRSVNRS